MARDSWYRNRKNSDRIINKAEKRIAILDMAIPIAARKHYMMVTKAEIGDIAVWAAQGLTYYFGMIDEFRISIVGRAIERYRQDKDYDSAIVIAQAIIVNFGELSGLTKNERFEILNLFV